MRFCPSSGLGCAGLSCGGIGGVDAIFLNAHFLRLSPGLVLVHNRNICGEMSLILPRGSSRIRPVKVSGQMNGLISRGRSWDRCTLSQMLVKQDGGCVSESRVELFRSCALGPAAVRYGTTSECAANVAD
jgi:hypothetical protein